MSDRLELVCPHCGGLNRVPLNRLQDEPMCGHCHQGILSQAPISLTERQFDRFVQRDQLPVLVDFWAPWCAPCRSFAPIYAQASALYATRVRFTKVDTEAEQGVAARYQIRSIPTLALFKHGREVDRISGALPLPQLKAWLARHGL